MSQTVDPLQQIEAAKAKQTAAEQAAADMESALADLADKKRQLEAAEEQLRRDRLQALKDQKAAELEEKKAALMIEPEPVTLEVARQLAKRMLVAFECETTLAEIEPRPEPLTSEELWTVVDEVRAKLLTQKVDQDARELVLGVEGVIQICDRWEHFRAGHVRTDVGGDGYGLGRDPRDCRPVKRLVKELRAMFDGKEPQKSESIGTLVSQGLDFNQVSRMLGMIDPTGNPDLPAIGTLCDRGRAAGPSWNCWRWRGCWDLGSAWAARQADVPVIRSRRANEVGGIAMGSHRPGRLSGIGVVRERREEIEENERQQYAAAKRAHEENIRDAAHSQAVRG